MFGPLSTFSTHLPSREVPPTVIDLVIPSLSQLPSPPAHESGCQLWGNILDPCVYCPWVSVSGYVILYSTNECSPSMSVPLFLTHFT